MIEASTDRKVTYFRPNVSLETLGSVVQTLHKHLQDIWTYIGLDGSQLNDSVIQTFLGEKSEEELIQSLDDIGFYQAVTPGMTQRTGIKMSTLASYLTAENYLDVGSGDGQLAQAVGCLTNKPVTLTDVVPLNTTDLPFHLYDGKKLPFENGEFDACLLYVVLHHCDDPEKVFREAARVARRRVIIVEAVASNYYEALISQFFDWFFNHIMIKAQEMPLAFAYRSPEHWVKQISQQGMNVTAHRDLGWDHLPLLPEHRCLYVADKCKK